MTGFALKLLAAATMLLDHVGAIFFPGAGWIRTIGRLSMPIFCFLAAEGAAHTSSIRRYCLRLALFGVLSELPFRLAFGIRLEEAGLLNVFFTLLLGVCTAAAHGALLRRLPRAGWVLSALAAGVLGLAGSWLHTDYGLYGVLLVWLFFVFRGRVPLQIAGSALLNALSVAFGLEGEIQLYSLLALFPLALYNGQRGRRLKYGFYLFYPLHLLFLWGVSLLLL